MADYPSSLLIEFPFDESTPDYGVIRTEMEMGYVQTRARTTIAPRGYKFSHRNLTASEISTWLTFWNARKGGGESFNFTDPRTSATVSCRFKQAQSVIRRTGPVTYDIDVELEEAL
ncbi:MAG: hypothetical protein IT393_07320 [Nitrospirae bacterium]|nr:hypothetical protein [Nitrospirota bacterium]